MRRGLFLLLLCLGSFAHGDLIRSVDGRTIQAEVLEADARGVLVRTHSMETRVPWARLDPAQAILIKKKLFVKEDLDRFTGADTITMDALLVSDQIGNIISMAPILDRRQVAADGATTVGLVFRRMADKWSWLESHGTYMIIDGVPTGKVKSEVIRTKVLDGGEVSEVVWADWSIPLLQKLAGASVVEIRVGQEEWTLTSEHRFRLQMFLDVVKDELDKRRPGVAK